MIYRSAKAIRADLEELIRNDRHPKLEVMVCAMALRSQNDRIDYSDTKRIAEAELRRLRLRDFFERATLRRPVSKVTF